MLLKLKLNYYINFALWNPIMITILYLLVLYNISYPINADEIRTISPGEQGYPSLYPGHYEIIEDGKTIIVINDDPQIIMANVMYKPEIINSVDSSIETSSESSYRDDIETYKLPPYMILANFRETVLLQCDTQSELITKSIAYVNHILPDHVFCKNMCELHSNDSNINKWIDSLNIPNLNHEEEAIKVSYIYLKAATATSSLHKLLNVPDSQTLVIEKVFISTVNIMIS